MSSTDRLPALQPKCAIEPCLEDAVVFDPYTGEGWCCDCFPDVVERWEAITIAPALRETLPGLNDR